MKQKLISCLKSLLDTENHFHASVLQNIENFQERQLLTLIKACLEETERKLNATN